MLDEMTVTQFREWQVFLELEPSLEVRIGVLFASLEAAVLNPYRPKKRENRPYSAVEFYRLFGDEPVPLDPSKTPEAKKERLREVARVMKAQAEKRKRV